MTTLSPRSTRGLAGVACRAYPWRRGGELYLGVVVKATYRLNEGAAMTPTVSRPCRTSPEGDLYPSDLVPYRPLADVVVRGRAFPREGGREGMHLRLDRGGEILVDKAAASAAELLPTRLHLLLPAGQDQVLEMPVDMAWQSFQCAPPDQRCGGLGGGETLRIAGAHPKVEVLQFQLPRVHGHAFLAEHDGPAWRPLQLSADLLAVDLIAYTAEISWRGAVALDAGTIAAMHVLGVVTEDLQALHGATRNALPAVPHSGALPAELPPHLAGLDLDTGTASVGPVTPSPHAGAPFALSAPGVVARAEIVALPGTPWAGSWPREMVDPPATGSPDTLPRPALAPTEPEPPPFVPPAPPSPVEPPPIEPPPVRPVEPAPVVEPPAVDDEPTMAAPAIPDRWQQVEEAPPLPTVPDAPGRAPVPNVRAMLYGNPLKKKDPS
ncbi:MAG: DUF2169 domain-containing protein [Polyangiaceae bacterium]